MAGLILPLLNSAEFESGGAKFSSIPVLARRNLKFDFFRRSVKFCFKIGRKSKKCYDKFFALPNSTLNSEEYLPPKRGI